MSFRWRCQRLTSFCASFTVMGTISATSFPRVLALVARPAFPFVAFLRDRIYARQDLAAPRASHVVGLEGFNLLGKIAHSHDSSPQAPSGFESTAGIRQSAI